MAEGTAEAVGVASQSDFRRLTDAGLSVEFYSQKVSDMDVFERLAVIGYQNEFIARQKDDLSALRATVLAITNRTPTQSCANCGFARATRNAVSLQCRVSPLVVGEHKWAVVRPEHWCGAHKAAAVAECAT